jgi:hypothetical protein
MATPAVGKRLYTAEELWELCQAGESYELVKGELREMPLYSSSGDIRLLKEADTLDGGEVAPGFSLPVVRVFA